MNYLREYVDDDQIPSFLGGSNHADLIDEVGPWHEYEIVDSMDPKAKVGIRRKGDPSGKIFGPKE